MVAPVSRRVSREDRAHLLRAATLAEGGRFAVEPNPPVGCVLVRRGRVVGEGFHRAYGGPHAEVEAIAAAGPRARGATAYVSLEPCSTSGKTRPCVDALVKAGVARVVFAVRDPWPRHRGRAKALLAAHGIACVEDAFPAAAGLLDAFRGALARTRPWVVVKWASSLDGRVSPREGEGGRLSGPEATRFVHELRGRVEAVAVGVGTVLVDDPRLTCRLPTGPPHGRPQPIAVVFDSRLSIPLRSRLVAGARRRPLVVFCARPNARRARALGRAGAIVIAAPARGGRVDLAVALRLLRELGVRRLLVEGGPTLAGALVGDRLVDQVAAIVAPVLLGGSGAPPALAGTGVGALARAPRLDPVRARSLGRDVLVEGFVAASAGTPARVSAASRS